MCRRPFILIEEKNSEIFKQYKYLIIQVEEIVPINEWNNLNIQFEINPYILYEDYKVIHLADGRYHYHRLVDSYQVYSFDSRYWKIYTEFSPCSKDKYNISLKYDSGEDYGKNYVNKYEEYGRKILGVSNDKWNNVILNVTVNESLTDNHYVAIKETKEFKIRNFIFENISINYDPMDTVVQSKWDQIKNVLDANSTFSTIYYYYLYEGEKNVEPLQSICSVLKPAHSTSTNDTDYNWIKGKEDNADYYDNHIVAYFMRGDEEFMVPFIPVKVEITSASYTAIWISIALGVTGLLIVYGTYVLYKEIKQRQKELDEEDDVHAEMQKNDEEILLI